MGKIENKMGLVIRVMVKDSKEEIIYEFHVKKVSFLIFNKVKTQVSIKNFFFGLLNYKFKLFELTYQKMLSVSKNKL